MLGALVAGVPLSPRVGRPGVSGFDRAAACTRCHAGVDGLDHPVGVPGLRSWGLPLTDRDRIDCLTCHDGRTQRARHAGAGDGLLRLPPRQLCARCHDPAAAVRGSAEAHGLAMRRAHLSSSDGGVGPRLDRESRLCLGCHDGGAAIEAAVAERREAGARSVALSRQHPIGVSYRADRGGRLRPIPSLAPTVRLPGGQVGCGSCHSYFAGREAMLALPPQRGGLCLACHLK